MTADTTEHCLFFLYGSGRNGKSTFVETTQFILGDYSHKLWMYGNHKPIIRGTDEAIWSRIPLIPFSVTIPVKERDPFLLDKLKAESSGILNWALDGCLLWQRHRLSPPEEVHEATKEYRDEMDVLSDFLDEYCVISHNSIAISKRLWEAYNDCMKTTNEKYPLTSLN